MYTLYQKYCYPCARHACIPVSPVMCFIYHCYEELWKAYFIRITTARYVYMQDKISSKLSPAILLSFFLCKHVLSRSCFKSSCTRLDKRMARHFSWFYCQCKVISLLMALASFQNWMYCAVLGQNTTLKSLVCNQSCKIRKVNMHLLLLIVCQIKRILLSIFHPVELERTTPARRRPKGRPSY
jgi:hypothetical protein